MQTQPLQQRQIHAHAKHGILGGVQVQVRKGLQDQGIAVILNGQTLQIGGQCLINTPDDAVLGYQIALFRDFQTAKCGGGDDSSFQNRY